MIRKRFFWLLGLYGVIDALMVDILLRRGDPSWAFETLRVSLFVLPVVYVLWSLVADGFGSLESFGRRAGLAALLVVCGFLNLMAMRSWVFDVVELGAESHSMWPTLKPEERVFVSRLSQVQKGDILVFRWTVEGEDYQVIKRVVALRGDRVSYTTSRLRLNGEELGQAQCPGVEEHEEGLYRQEDLGEHKYCVTMDLADSDEWVDEVHVSEDFFIVGDNRNDSRDSRWGRSEYPFNKSHLIGVVILPVIRRVL